MSRFSEALYSSWKSLMQYGRSFSPWMGHSLVVGSGLKLGFQDDVFVRLDDGKFGNIRRSTGHCYVPTFFQNTRRRLGLARTTKPSQI